MIQQMIPIIVGGLLAIVGGALQTYLSANKSAKQRRLEKREDAYLGYVDALLTLHVSRNWGTINIEDFQNSFRNIQAKLRLYGSDNVVKKAQSFEEHLYECWECGNMDVGGTEEKKVELIEVIRNESNVK